MSDDARDPLGTRYSRKQLVDLPTVVPLIDGVLSKPAAAVLVGPYGLGKSFLAQAWCASVATGTPWLGRSVARCPVLYVVGEGAYGLDARLGAWEQQTGVEITADQLTICVQPDSLVKAEVWDALEIEAATGRHGLVVLDTFSSLAFDADETKDSAQIMRRCAELAASIEGTVLLVHHPGHSDASRARGGYQFEANADEVLILAGEQDSPQISLTRKKVKDGPDGGVVWLVRKPAHGSVVIETARLDEIDAPLKSRVRVALQMAGEAGLSTAQLHEHIGTTVKRTSILRVLRDMKNAGLARVAGTEARPLYLLPAFDLEREG